MRLLSALGEGGAPAAPFHGKYAPVFEHRGEALVAADARDHVGGVVQPRALVEVVALDVERPCVRDLAEHRGHDVHASDKSGALVLRLTCYKKYGGQSNSFTRMHSPYSQASTHTPEFPRLNSNAAINSLASVVAA